MKKWVYLFSEGNRFMSTLLGGKGANLCGMTKLGLPIPPGFIITTEACNEYFGRGRKLHSEVWEQILEALASIEEETGKKLGDPANPLFVSVRSGAKFSMPGMMETILNLGLNEETLNGFIAQTNNPRFANDAYRRFLQMYGEIVFGIDATAFGEILTHFRETKGVKSEMELNEESLEEIVHKFKEITKTRSESGVPDDPLDQLKLAIEAVFSSWNSKRAIDYRNANKISHSLGTAVNVQTMVFGNAGENSGSGVLFTRSPATGEKSLYGEYLINAQGEDIVAGVRTPKKIGELRDEEPEIYEKLAQVAKQLERHFRDAQDIEFTFESGKLYILQTRAAKRTAQAAVKIAVNMVEEGLISKEDAVGRIDPNSIYQFLVPRFDQSETEFLKKKGNLLAVGLNASPGAASGKVVFNASEAEELGSKGESIILVRPETSGSDYHGMLKSKGVLTAHGGLTSHAAVVARGIGLPCIVGCEAIKIDIEKENFSTASKVILEDEEISIDGYTGEVFLGSIPTIAPDLSQEKELLTLLDWADEFRTLSVRANADTPNDAVRALMLGAEGIGLCRTEHMFFEENFVPVVQRVILSAEEATKIDNELEFLEQEIKIAPPDRQLQLEKRIDETLKKREASLEAREFDQSLKEFTKFQKRYFKGIMNVMGDRPVAFRLLDPPLNEFLPQHEDVLVGIIDSCLHGKEMEKLEEKGRILNAIARIQETNPMLGLRGCRLGLIFPRIYKSQMQAILTATAELIKEGFHPLPEIVFPMTSTVSELDLLLRRVKEVAEEVERESGSKIHYKVGAMIEVPSATLAAGEIASLVDTFSFGTNDLTQMTFGYSRDEAEKKFLSDYVKRGIFDESPFQVFDQKYVGRLLQLAVEEGRKSQPAIEMGVCGEHGGDPPSIEFFCKISLDYVSCSPLRVPIARLAAAQATLETIGHRRYSDYL